MSLARHISLSLQSKNNALCWLRQKRKLRFEEKLGECLRAGGRNPYKEKILHPIPFLHSFCTPDCNTILPDRLVYNLFKQHTFVPMILSNAFTSKNCVKAWWCYGGSKRIDSINMILCYWPGLYQIYRHLKMVCKIVSS